MKKKWDIIRQLFFAFLKISTFTFGGGYAMISLISQTCVDQKKWITDDEMMDITVIAESTPGPISINAATYVGYKQASMWGAVAASVGTILPSFVVIYVISTYLTNFLSIPLVAKAFSGIKIAVGFLILDAGFRMIKSMPKGSFSVAFLTASFLSMCAIQLFSLPVTSIHLILIAGFISLIISIITKNVPKGGKKVK